MKYERQLKDAFEKTGLTQQDISKALDISRNTVANRFKSKEVEKLIEFFDLLGLKIINQDGKNIITGEKEIIQIGSLTLTKQQLEDLKTELGIKTE